jgi:hypothetical protein
MTELAHAADLIFIPQSILGGAYTSAIGGEQEAYHSRKALLFSYQHRIRFWVLDRWSSHQIRMLIGSIC